MDWKGRKEVRFSSQKLSYFAMYNLIHFFYCDRLEVAVDDMEDLSRTWKVCKCDELQKILKKESIHQKYIDYKSLKDVDNSQKRFILQGLSLPEGDRLSSALCQILQTSLAKSLHKHTDYEGDDDGYEKLMGQYDDDIADVCIKVEKRIFRCHQGSVWCGVFQAARRRFFHRRAKQLFGRQQWLTLPLKIAVVRYFRVAEIFRDSEIAAAL
ncbi:BTB/POZ domain-containing protein [Platanthera zijinensis]|uniref:BTB/POZ domain-containing protein n=1 Tax=Platanthera zijinensis TaxID=2320716 RepID=A0AAP0BJM4_9ASPA